MYGFVLNQPLRLVDPQGDDAGWQEPLFSQWDVMSRGQLTSCPEHLELPPAIDDVLTECVFRTHSAKREVEWGGLLAYNLNSPLEWPFDPPPFPVLTVPHRIYGPVIGSNYPQVHSVEPEDAMPASPPSGEVVYGWYHSHTYQKESQLSKGDLRRFLEGPVSEKIKQTQRYQIALMRDCECTKALVRLGRTPSWEEIEDDFNKLSLYVLVRDWYDAMAEVDQTIADFAGAHSFCLYRSCDPSHPSLAHAYHSQRVLQLVQPGAAPTPE